MLQTCYYSRCKKRFDPATSNAELNTMYCSQAHQDASISESR